MITKVQRWGNSQGLRLPKEVLHQARINIGDEVRITIEDGGIMLVPARRVRGKHQLEDLVSRIPPGYQPEEVDWGASVGGEAW